MRPRRPPMKPAIAALPLLALLSACSAFGPGEEPSAARVEPDPAEVLLAEAAARAGRALASLAQARAAGNPPADPPAPDTVPAELRRAVSLDWIGPLETLAGDLAQRAGYSFVSAGPTPVRPAIIEVRFEDAPLIAAFRDAGIQGGEGALLTVDAQRRSVRLDWAADTVPERP